MALEIQVMAWDNYRNASGLNRLIGPHISLGKWISNVITGKKSSTDPLRHLWFVFRIVSLMYVFLLNNNKK